MVRPVGGGGTGRPAGPDRDERNPRTGTTGAGTSRSIAAGRFERLGAQLGRRMREPGAEVAREDVEPVPASETPPPRARGADAGAGPSAKRRRGAADARDPDPARRRDEELFFRYTIVSPDNPETVRRRIPVLRQFAQSMRDGLVAQYRLGPDAVQAASAGFVERAKLIPTRKSTLNAGLRGLDTSLADGSLQLPDTPPSSPVVGEVSAPPAPSPEAHRRQAALSRDDRLLIDAFAGQGDPAQVDTQPQAGTRRHVLAGALSRLAEWMRAQVEPDGSLRFPGGLRSLVAGDDGVVRQTVAAYRLHTRTADNTINEAVDALRECFPVSADVVRRLGDKALLEGFRQMESHTPSYTERAARLREFANWVPGGLTALLRQGSQAMEDALNDYIATQNALGPQQQRKMKFVRGPVRAVGDALASGRLPWPIVPAVRLPGDAAPTVTTAATQAGAAGEQRRIVALDDDIVTAAFLGQRDPARSEARHRTLTGALSRLGQWQRRQLQADGSPRFPGGLRNLVELDEAAVEGIFAAYGRSPRPNIEVTREAVETLRQMFPVDAGALRKRDDDALIRQFRTLRSGTGDVDGLCAQLRHFANATPQGLTGLFRQGSGAVRTALAAYVASIPVTPRHGSTLSEIRRAVAKVGESLEQGRLRLPEAPPALPPKPTAAQADAPAPPPRDTILDVVKPIVGRRFAEFEALWQSAMTHTGRRIDKLAFLRRLYELTTQSDTPAVATGKHGITHYTVRLHEGMDPVYLLRRDDTDGALRDLQLVPGSGEAERSRALETMVRRAIQSTFLRTSRGMAPEVQERLRALWAFRKDAFQPLLETIRQDRQHAYLSGPGFLQVLHELSDEAPRTETPVPGLHRVTVRLPRGEREPVAVELLRRIDANGNLEDIHRLPESPSEQAKLFDWIGQGAASASEPGTAFSRSQARQGIQGIRSTPVSRLGDVARLNQALGRMLDNREQGRPLFDGAAPAAGLPESTLREWVHPDGSLKGSEVTLAYAKGYGMAWQTLERQFRGLGQHASAERLLRPVSVAGLVRALQGLRDNPSARPTDLARLARIPPGAVDRHIDMESGELLSGNSWLRRLPDYEDHREALDAVLQELGQAERANALPAPATAAEVFLDDLHDHFFPVMAAVRAMRSEPGLSVHGAAEIAGDAPELPALLERLVEPGGALREAQEIAARLPGFDESARPALERLVGHMRTLLASGPSTAGQGASPSDMTAMLLPNNGIRGADKVFVVHGNDARLKGLAKGLREIYAASPDLVREPRVFDAAERPRQYLRWLATALKRQFPRGLEVQAYWDADNRQIWVSSNSTSINRHMQVMLASGQFMEMLHPPPGSELTDREARHIDKLRAELDAPSAQASAQAREVLEAMAGGRFRVPLKRYFHDGAKVDLHAERRIQDALGRDLDPGLLGGVRRPCMTCASALGQPEGMRSGPAWLSGPGKAYIDVVGVVNENVRNRIGSHVTRGLDGRLTLGHDTDSESDEPAAAVRRGKRPAPEDAGPSQPVRGPRSARRPRVDLSGLGVDGDD